MAEKSDLNKWHLLRVPGTVGRRDSDPASPARFECQRSVSVTLVPRPCLKCCCPPALGSSSDGQRDVVAAERTEQFGKVLLIPACLLPARHLSPAGKPEHLLAALVYFPHLARSVAEWELFNSHWQIFKLI